MLYSMLTLLAMAIASSAALAQVYPTRPVRLIVADAAGGAPDQLARVLAKTLSENLGQQVVVDNRPGAAGALGADIAARSPADGYTLLLTTTAIYAILPSLKKNLSYDPERDFVPISRIATASNVLVVNVALPVQSVADLVRLAKS
jgi:tripartite-type tricarboxylate transporter receptor subunit TctC